MCKRLDLMSLTQIVDGPPMKDFIEGGGNLVKEACGLVGFVAIDADRRQYLEDLGVNMTWAEYSSDSERWERCLMSEGVAELLEDLHAEGDFPYHFEVAPSRGDLAWLRAQAEGALERPELPLREYLLGASAEELDAMGLGNDRRKARRHRKDG